jgi:NAD-dependent SIR2 family protein deacetylase
MKDNTRWRKTNLRAMCPDGYMRFVHEALETLECSHCHREIQAEEHFTKRNKSYPVCKKCEPFEEHESNIEAIHIIPSDESISRALELYGEPEDYQEWLSSTGMARDTIS